MATLDWSQCPAVESIPGKASGAWVFKDTRMPVATVFENFGSWLDRGRSHGGICRHARSDQRGAAFRCAELGNVLPAPCACSARRIAIVILGNPQRLPYTATLIELSRQ